MFTSFPTFSPSVLSISYQCLYELQSVKTSLNLNDLVYKLKRIVGSNIFSAQFINLFPSIKSNVLQQNTCLVVNPTTVENFAFLFNCTPVGRTSDSMMVPI